MKFLVLLILAGLTACAAKRVPVNQAVVPTGYYEEIPRQCITGVWVGPNTKCWRKDGQVNCTRFMISFECVHVRKAD